jgi:hypothetical protein
MALTSANLVGYLRAEFNKASKQRVELFYSPPCQQLFRTDTRGAVLAGARQRLAPLALVVFQQPVRSYPRYRPRRGALLLGVPRTTRSRVILGPFVSAGKLSSTTSRAT